MQTGKIPAFYSQEPGLGETPPPRSAVHLSGSLCVFVDLFVYPLLKKDLESLWVNFRQIKIHVVSLKD